MGRRWQDMSPAARRAVVTTGALEGVLKVAALVDIARRPATQMRGTKVGWALAVLLVNSAGAVPVAYFVWGRRPAATA